MFQRDVVDRILAVPGNSKRGYLTVIVEAFLRPERLFDVPPSAFRPPPKVWSSVVRLKPNDTEPVPGDLERKFEKLVSAAFRQKRKTIQNNLRHAANELGIAEDIVQVLAACEIDANRRAESLTIGEWARLTKRIA